MKGKISAALGTYFWVQHVRELAEALAWQTCTHSDKCNSNMTMHLNARHVNSNMTMHLNAHHVKST